MKKLKFLQKIIYTFLATFKFKNYRTKPNIFGYTKFNSSTTLGTNTNFNGFKVFGKGTVKIGDNFHSGSGCILITQVHDYEGKKIPYDENYKTKKIVIEDNVWLGLNVFILSSCTIGEGSILQAGSVVVSDIPKYAIAGGNPAKVFKYRNKTHYNNLKNENKFH